MQRPRTVTAAVVILGVSLAYRALSDITTGILAVTSSGGVVLSVGRLVGALIVYAALAWILGRVAQGRNWARVVSIFTVVVAVSIALTILQRPALAATAVPPVLVAIRAAFEAVAVVLLLLSGSFFAEHESV